MDFYSLFLPIHIVNSSLSINHLIVLLFNVGCTPSRGIKSNLAYLGLRLDSVSTNLDTPLRP